MHRRPALVYLNRLLWSGIAWWALSNGAVGWDAWAIGVPTVAAAALVSTALMPPTRWSSWGAVRFAWYFAFESLRGGIDVARRALDPRMPLAPDVIREELPDAPDLARVMVANTLGLLPGSLVVDIDGRVLYVHALDAGAQGGVARSIEGTRRRIGHLLRVPGYRPAPPAAKSER